MNIDMLICGFMINSGFKFVVVVFYQYVQKFNFFV